MPKRLIKRYLPDYHTLREHRHLRFLGTRLHDPNLWHLNRRSVAGAMGIGIFIAFIPVPAQMLLSAIAAVWLRVNLALAVAMAWITNPITMPPIFYVDYKVGSWLLGQPAQPLPFHFSMEWVMQEIQQLWQPFLVGSVVVGMALGMVAYIAVRLLWRIAVLRRRRRDTARRALRNGQPLG
ncbi:MAG TPA: DUF2062 domain-containing protein [Candidatus Competibacteraceae bacterium]|nr:DUF2062 domain-containing protein [Candidatus Competibacteraceae bacterium]